MSRYDVNFRLKDRVQLKVAVVYLKTWYKPDGSEFLNFANDKLWDHNIGMDIFPDGGKKLPTNTIDYGGKVIPDTTAEYKKLYAVAKAKIKTAGCHYVNPLIVAFCQFQNAAYGVAPNLESDTNRLCLIAPHATNPGDLLHEIGHASGLHHDFTTKSPRNFMDTYGDRETVYRYQVESIGRAVFAVG
ncbi:MAG: hypothetical protein R2681_08920 [Pyrinomonadaceae bacterium]